MTTAARIGTSPRRPARTLGALAAGLATVILTGTTVPVTAATPHVEHGGRGGHDTVSMLQADLDAVAASGAIGVVGATQDGRGRQWSGAAGQASLLPRLRARADDTVRVGSVTKSMVATVALQQVERGRLRLDTTVEELLPGLLGEHGGVTLEQLLSHTSGVPDYIFAVIADPTVDKGRFLRSLYRHRTDRELVRSALGQPWLFEPGTGWSYSNTGFVLAGMLVQRATHRPLRHLLERDVFGPAGMRSARLPTWGPTFTSRHLTDHTVLDDRPHDLDHTSSSLFSAAGAVVVDAADAGRFYRALIGGRLVSQASLAQMLAPRSTSPPAYGLGIYAVVDPCPAADGSPQPLYGHDGATFGTQTLVFSSADGTRQASIAFTGRRLLDPQLETFYRANDFLVDAFTASCPRPVPPVAQRRRTDRWQVPAPDAASLVPTG